MSKTKVSYQNNELRIQYPSHTKICKDIASTRIELRRIINYRKKCDEKKFFHYVALADQVKSCLDLMVEDYERKVMGELNAKNANC